MSQQQFFDQQRRIGEAGEAQLDAFFARAYRIERATAAEQLLEIDRWFTSLKTGNRFAVEYKRDDRAGTTGNAFIELKSNLEWDTPGWAYTSKADYLIYFVTEPETIYVICFEELRHALPRWLMRYPQGNTRNPKFTTRGVIVPLHELERCADRVF